jgi:hypothetical protein
VETRVVLFKMQAMHTQGDMEDRPIFQEVPRFHCRRRFHNKEGTREVITTGVTQDFKGQG